MPTLNKISAWDRAIFGLRQASAGPQRARETQLLATTIDLAAYVFEVSLVGMLRE